MAVAAENPMRYEQKNLASWMRELLQPKSLLPNKHSRAKTGGSKKNQRRGGGRKSRGGMAVIPHQPKGNSLTILEELWAPLFPARTTKKLRYATSASLSCSAVGVVTGRVYSANGLFDPDVTGVGHQPMGFDQMMLSYDHYYVTASKIEVLFKNISATTINVAIRTDADTVITSSADTLLESGMLLTETLEAKSTYGSAKRLQSAISIRKFQGVDDVLDVVELRGTVAANPVEGSFFHVVCWDPTLNGGTVSVEVVMEFTATFTEPRMITPSLLKGLHRLRLEDEAAARPPPSEVKTGGWFSSK